MTRASVRGASIVAALLCALVASVARAHERSVSRSRWTIDRVARPGGGEVLEYTVALSLSARDLGAAPALASSPPPARGRLDARAQTYLMEHVRLESARGRCAPDPDSARGGVVDGRVTLRWRGSCPDAGPWTLRGELLVDALPGHLHFARARGPDGRSRERVLSDGARAWRSAPASSGARESITLARALALGVEHILGGYDHLLFVLGLVLGAPARARALAWVITGFTAGHSLTLALATLGVVAPAPAAVEALIAASIALLAIENAWLFGQVDGARVRPWRAHALLAGALALALALVAAARGDGLELGVLGLGLVVVCQLGLAARAARPGATRWLLAAVFGLIHGFGFAGALRSAELPRADALRVLLGFNLGVELGQLVVVALLAAVFTALARRGRDGLARALGNAALVGAGVYWFILRALA